MMKIKISSAHNILLMFSLCGGVISGKQQDFHFWPNSCDIMCNFI